MPPSDAPSPQPSLQPRRRWRWVLLVVGLLAAAAVAVPLLAPSYVAGLIKQRLERELEAEVELTGFSASLGGRARLDGLEVVRLDGRPLASLGPTDVSFDPWGLFAGRIHAALQVEGFEVHVEEVAGEWDVGLRTSGGVGRGRREPRERPDREEPRQRTADPLPDLRLALDVTGGRIVVHGEQGTTTVHDLDVSFHLADPREAAQAQLSFRIEAPDGEAGRVDGRADVTLAPDGDFHPDRVLTDGQFALGDVRLEALTPLVGVLIPGRRLEGRLSGNGAFQAEGLLDAEGQLRLLLREAAVTEPRSVALPDMDLMLTAARQADGTGTQSLEAEARGLFRAVWEGTLTPGADTDALTGSLTVDGRIDNIHRLLSELMDMGTASLQGAFGVRAGVDVRLAEGEPVRATVDGRVQAVELGYDDGAGFAVLTGRGELSPQLAWEATGDGTRAILTGDGSFDTVSLGLDGMDVPLSDVAFEYTATAEDGGPVLELDGGLVVQDGRVGVELSLDAREQAAARSTLSLKADGVQARAETAVLLAAVHPLFAKAGEGGETHGVLDLDGHVAFDGPLPRDEEPFPVAALTGRGRLALADASVSAPGELAELLDRFGMDTGRGLSVRPLELDLHDGRLHYAEPWAFEVDGRETFFSGSVGLDGSLDLAWSLPVTEDLTDRYGFLRPLEGESLTLPVRGTTEAPRVEWDALMGELREELVLGRLEDVQRDLDVLRGETDEDPARLLAEADGLWEQGREDEARVIYKRLREDFRLSLVYLLNKDHIKDRAEEPKPDKPKKKNKKKGKKKKGKNKDEDEETEP